METDLYSEATTVASDYINAYFTHLRTPTSRPNLSSLYRPHSTTLWNEMYQTGGSEIMDFYNNLPYERMEFQMKQIKVCPTGKGVDEKGVMVLVMGDMHLDGQVQEGVYEVFYLERDESGWFIGGQILGFVGGVEGEGGGGGVKDLSMWFL